VPAGNNPGIGRTTSSSEPTSGTDSAVSPHASLSGTVIDAQSQKPVLAATVFHNGVASRTAADGKFELKEVDPSKPVWSRPVGTGRRRSRFRKTGR
jgi:hypothetical protein